jgi:hypothetical protein
MSDYLNNLVVRTLQRQEVVRPRLTSLFEPSAIGPPFASPADVETISFGQPQATRSSLQPPVAPPQESRPPAPPLAHLPARHEAFTKEAERDGLEVRLSGAPATREREPSPVEPVPLVAVKTEDEERPPSHTQTEKPAPVVVVRNDTRDGHNLKSAAKVEKAPTIEGETNGLEARLAALEARRSDDTGRQEAGWQAPSEVAQEAPPPAAPYFSPRFEPPARGFVSPQERPHITVTIGRVDVRAVFPTPADTPRPAASRPGSTTTLAEYLKQRERGQR